MAKQIIFFLILCVIVLSCGCGVRLSKTTVTEQGYIDIRKLGLTSEIINVAPIVGETAYGTHEHYIYYTKEEAPGRVYVAKVISFDNIEQIEVEKVR